MSFIPEVHPSEIDDDAVMVDVREQNEWDAGHAPNAVHIPLGELPSRLGDLPDEADTVPIICRSGNRSGRAVAWLVHQGFDVSNVAGGMQEWARGEKPMSAAAGDPRVI
jgi:rhodanese-related sulfurtransferase